ncbi:MAG: cyclopropane-fatty-acyl-phospholipid synthase family protein [Nitrospirota bacterium]|nr:cyclopropane-fatty-acyl-phospholipid synthase family protein [Nitrospirota bacterium]
MDRDSIVPECQEPGVRIVPSGLLGALTRFARKMVLSRLAKIERGRITLIEGSDHFEFGGQEEELQATITVCDTTFYTDIMFGGSIGAAESYMSGFWSADELTALIRIIILNEKVLLDIEGGMAQLTAPLHRLFHKLRINTRDGSRRNITAHYDLGNDFYSLWLDKTMTYSCNIFERENSTLEEAAIAKYDRICKKLRLGPQDHVLEIGTGWGEFALHAVRNYGCRVTTTTISRQQQDWAKARFDREGLSGSIQLLFEDYRDLKGKFDRLVSIEMIEAVGHHFLDTYFKTCSRLLKDDGMMALQAITMTDQVYDAHLRSPDFIKRYIFPGSFVPSINAIVRSVAQATDMKLVHLEDITPHYARTLRAWRERFFANIEMVKKLGFPESFLRMWEYYLCYCEAGFRERYIGDAQMIFLKPDCRPDPILPHSGSYP